MNSPYVLRNHKRGWEGQKMTIFYYIDGQFECSVHFLRGPWLSRASGHWTRKLLLLLGCFTGCLQKLTHAILGWGFWTRFVCRQRRILNSCLLRFFKVLSYPLYLVYIQSLELPFILSIYMAHILAKLKMIKLYCRFHTWGKITTY